MQALHAANYIHLDLKPANILVDFYGRIKIGDFGLACAWPAPKHHDGEGDREYIAPEVLNGRFDKPADVFAVGLITLEIGGNFFLPDNGEIWHRLRSGNLSEIPSLTWSADSNLDRDEDGVPIDVESSKPSFGSNPFVSPPKAKRPVGVLTAPPDFMFDAENDDSLDRLVIWMLNPDPDQRPTFDQILEHSGLQWVSTRRRAGASVFEGNWGPADKPFEGRLNEMSVLLDADVEMSDV